jgi:hypothetical protein
MTYPATRMLRLENGSYVAAHRISEIRPETKPYAGVWIRLDDDADLLGYQLADNGDDAEEIAGRLVRWLADPNAAGQPEDLPDPS